MQFRFHLISSLLVALWASGGACFADEDSRQWLEWEALPDLPDHLGVAGPFVGVHAGALIVAGGANFPKPVWESDKKWRDRIYVLPEIDGKWIEGGSLETPLAYGAAVSTSEGVVCIGGNDSEQTFDGVFLLRFVRSTQTVERIEYPSLPRPCAYAQATLVGNKIYVAGGQSASSLDSAMKNFWSLDLSMKDMPGEFEWHEMSPWPGDSRAFNLTVSQHNGYEDCVYVLSGRRQNNDEVQFLSDVWEYAPSSTSWRRRADLPRCVMAGTAIDLGQSHFVVLGGADGSLFSKADELKDDHPGFPKEALAYHTITDTWTSAGKIPMNQVTTIPVRWRDRIVLVSGEIRPRVRTPSVWKITPIADKRSFGAINYGVLCCYLAAMVGVGIYFSRKSQSTEEYFRGGKHVPWWAAGCSIFATMLSSLTFTGIPSKAYAQDWVYSVGNFMIPLTAIVAVFFALPFYRKLDVTSAYEYLEKRFNRAVRLFGSASFVLFHLFRMAVVLSLTALALTVATPLSPTQSVLLMGVLSIIYCTLGGVEAVIWTDTLQTFVLLGGALIALVLMVLGSDGGWSGSLEAACDANKLRIANFHTDVSDAQVAFWVVVVGGFGQQLSSYTSDQAVVQRYMTTANQTLAARSIWTNAVLTVPATLLFFGIGTALFAYYRSNPDRVDPTITTDQIFPLFIAREMPAGLAGLIVAGVFSAAQSTISTSMNSTATAVVTDWMRPLKVCKSERSYLWSARFVTLVSGVSGTLLALLFIDPEIKSLFDASIKVIGLFMGVLGGLFLLGIFTRRANATGALIGAFAGAAVMFCLWKFTRVNGFLYTVSGITSCYMCGYLTSLTTQGSKELEGLTVYTLRSSN